MLDKVLYIYISYTIKKQTNQNIQQETDNSHWETGTIVLLVWALNFD